MTTNFSTLPIVDLQALRDRDGLTAESELTRLSQQLYDVFATTGFAYLVNAPLSFSHDEVFELTRGFFGLPLTEKMKLAKKTFQPDNPNTYRGYFPTQPLSASDNLKEGFEIGPKTSTGLADHGFPPQLSSGFNLTEPNVWPSHADFRHRTELEQLHEELQTLASTLLSLLAMSLGKPADFFEHYLRDSISTLRLLHYPPVSPDLDNRSSASLDSVETFGSVNSEQQARLSCTPHTDSGILTLLHQDSTGGLEVRNAAGEWVPAPYVPGCIVVNIGDLMAEISCGRFVATMHRVKAPPPQASSESGMHDFGRFSVPFFFEPGEHCVIKSVEDIGAEHGILYGEHVRRKMKGWVEFRDEESDCD